MIPSSIRSLLILAQEISDADFEALQAKMFGTKDSGDSSKAQKKSKKSKT